ncbi:transposase [Nitrosococcus watsonii]|uniref:transposase n=1 Tax=Nitrosococcus watsonii TaxID=473531 RepID=UPI00059CE196|nr:transposase [Nitrosococcus watsonii]
MCRTHDLYGMKSDRALCREVHLNVAYRWFCRLEFTDSVPHHSSMSRIRDRFGESIFAEIFERLIRHWQEEEE